VVDANEVRAAWERAARRVAAGGAPPEADASSGAAGRVPTFGGVPAAIHAEELEGAVAVVLGIPFGGPGDAPDAVRRHSLTCAHAALLGLGSVSEPPDLERLGVVDYGDVAVAVGDVEETFTRAHERLADIVAAGAVPIVFGGDHSVTVPVLQVLAGKLSGKLGIVSLDARLDLEFRPRYQAGSQWARAFELGIVEPANFVAVGVRDGGATSLATAVAEELRLRVYTMDDIDMLGIVTVAQEALEHAGAGTEAIYVSLDVGVAGSGPPQRSPHPPDGLGGRELVGALRVLSRGRVAGFDVCGATSSPPFAGELGRQVACAALEVLRGLAAQRP
jgi:arginase family enzyme